MSILQILTVRRLSLKPLLVTVVCFLSCWLGQDELQAQQILIRMGGGAKEKLELYNQFNNLYEGKRDAAKNRLESRLFEIDRACELSPKQRMRLEVAGKGAVVAYSKKVLEKLEREAKKSGVEFDRANPPDEDADDEQDDDVIVARGVRIVEFAVGPNGDLKETVDTEQIWVSSIKKTLTEAQIEKLELWTTAKQKIIRQAAVDYLIAKADLKMFLSREQSQKLKAFVDKKYGRQLVQQMKVPPKQNRNLIIAGAPQRNREVDDIEVDDSLKEFLSEPQLKIWKTDFHDNLDRLVW